MRLCPPILCFNLEKDVGCIGGGCSARTQRRSRVAQQRTVPSRVARNRVARCVANNASTTLLDQPLYRGGGSKHFPLFIAQNVGRKAALVTTGDVCAVSQSVSQSAARIPLLVICWIAARQQARANQEAAALLSLIVLLLPDHQGALVVSASPRSKNFKRAPRPSTGRLLATYLRACPRDCSLFIPSIVRSTDERRRRQPAILFRRAQCLLLLFLFVSFFEPSKQAPTAKTIYCFSPRTTTSRR